MKSTPEIPAKKPEGLSRRRLLQIFAGGALLAVPTVRAIHTSLKPLQSDPADHPPAPHASDAVSESATENATDIQSAGAVLAAFGYFVGFEGIYRGEALGPTSAGTMLSLAMGRTALLSMQGDPHLAAEGKRERHEILDGVKNTGILVALADAATHEQTGVRADAEKIFAESADAVLGSPIWGADRPALDANREIWLAYEQKLNQTISGFVAEIMGFSGVMAPIATTFVSSAIANQLKEKVARAMFELNIAKTVCSMKAKSAVTIDINAVNVEAKAKTETAINGPLGFTNLLLATAANAQGSLGLGGAPYIFTVGDNFADPKQFAANTIVGSVNALAAPAVLSMLWLSSVGIVKDGLSLKALIHRYIDTARAGLNAFNSKRSVSFGGAKAYTQGVKDALSASAGEKKAMLAAQLANIPDAEIQFDVLSHLLSKGDSFAGWVIELLKLHRPEQQLSAGDIWQAFQAKDANKLKSMLSGRIKVGQENDAVHLASLFHTIHDGVAVSVKDSTILQKPIATADYTSGQRAAQAVQTLFDKSIMATDAASFEQEVDLVLGAQGLTSKTVGQALKSYTTIKGKEDAVPNPDVVHQDGLSHSAKEAAWALLTQVPAVPSAVRMAEHVIPQIAGIHPGQRPSAEQLKTISTIVIVLVTALSAVADNVAAFLFGKSVLLKFFEQALGKAYMDGHPDLARKLTAACITVAQNAGAITKLGSPTNFAQQKMLINLDPSQAQGMAIDRVDLPIADTVTNVHALTWNTIAGSVAVATIQALIDDAMKEAGSR